MKAYETSATVDKAGTLQVPGVPFAPGTEVEVTIREKQVPDSAAPLRISEVFARVQARNTESVGPLRREELYDRKVLR